MLQLKFLSFDSLLRDDRQEPAAISFFRIPQTGMTEKHIGFALTPSRLLSWVVHFAEYRSNLYAQGNKL